MPTSPPLPSPEIPPAECGPSPGSSCLGVECGQLGGGIRPLPSEGEPGPAGTPEVSSAAAVGAAGTTPFPPNCGEGENQLGQTWLLTLQGGRIPSPRGQGSKVECLADAPAAPALRGGLCLYVCMIKDPRIQWQGPVKPSKALPCKIITYFFSRLKGKMEGYLI